MSKKQPKRVKNNAFLPKKRKKHLFKTKKNAQRAFFIKGFEKYGF